MEKFEAKLERCKRDIQGLKHISAIDLFKNYVVPLVCGLHDDVEEGFHEVGDALEAAETGGIDPEDADLLKGTLAGLAALVEELLISNGLITLEGPDGNKTAKATEKTPAGLMDRLAALNEAVVECFDVLDDGENDDGEDEDEDEGDEGDEDEPEETEAAPLPPTTVVVPAAVVPVAVEAKTG